MIKLKESRHPSNLFSIRGIMGCCHLWIEDDEAILIDAGMIGESYQITRILKRHGLGLENIKAILLTHGHIDHTGNLFWLRKHTAAPLYAHTAERDHIKGIYPYTGINRWCGRLEALARVLVRYKPIPFDVPLEDGDLLPFVGGLKVIHLPGHTLGHCGFYSERHRLLFSGDMFASYFFNIHRPPAILNSAPELLSASFKRMRDLSPELIIPGHYDFFDGVLHRERFIRYCDGWITK